MKRAQRLRLARKTRALKEETRERLWTEVDAVADAAIVAMGEADRFRSRDEALAASRAMWQELQLLGQLVTLGDKMALAGAVEATALLWRAVHQYDLTEEEVKA